MAKVKITELAAITAAQLADGDMIPVVDVSDTTMSSTGTNKRLAKSELAANLAADAALSSRLTPATFYVDWYLPAGVTPATATSAQTLAAYNAARDAAFAVSGTVKFTPGRTYQIDTTFIIKSNMTFDCSGATLRKRSGTGNQTPLIVNENWATGNTDITVIAHGSVWDHNGLAIVGASGQPYGGLGDCVHFRRVDRLTIIGRPFIKDASKYALCIGNARDVEIDGARFDTRSDGLHLMSPVSRVKVGTLSGVTGDDFCALSINNYPDQINNLTANGETVTMGDIEDVRVDCLQISNGALPTGGHAFGSGLAILGGSGTFKHRRIHVGTITGVSQKAARITIDAILTNLQVEDVTIDKIAVAGRTANAQVVYVEPTAMDSLTIGEIVSNDTGSATPLQINGGTIRNIKIGKFQHRGANAASSLLVGATAVLDQIDIDSVHVAYAGTTGRFFQSNSTSPVMLNIGTMRLTDPAATGWGWGFYANGSGVVTVNLTNGLFAGITQVARVDASTLRLFAANLTVDNCFQLFNLNNAASVVRFTAANVRQVASADRAVAKVAGALFSANGASYRVPVDTRIDNAQAIAGDIVYNSIAGTTPLGLVQYNGTAWVAV